MKLVISEKPAVAQAIRTVLGADNKENGYYSGNGYIVSWCYGHLAGLKYPDGYCEKWAAAPWSFEQLPMIPDEWQLTVSSGGKSREQFGILKKLMNSKDVDEVICATDADREGECIFRYVYMLAGCKKPVKRLWVSSLEESAIRDGFNKLKSGKEYDNLFAAGFSRAKADWLVGMNGSRLFSCRYGGALNIGRVQTPTLAMIVKRENDIRGFVKQQYFTVDLDCGGFVASSERIDNEATANALRERCNGKTAVVKSVKKETKTVNAPKLFDLTTLQREANRKFGYTAQQTLDYQQSLYEKQLSTYPRTDCQFITDDMEHTAEQVADIAAWVFGFGIQSRNIKQIVNNSKVTGHHAIIPTVNIEKADLNALPEGEKNILMLTALRLLCAVGKPYKYEAVKAVLSCEDTEFTVTGKNVLSEGWKALADKLKDKDEKDEAEKALPDIAEGQEFTDVSAGTSSHWTTPPKSYTEDTLLSAMEHAGREDFNENSERKGLGTPATRSGTIEGLIKHGYAQRDGKKITVTEKGRNLIDIVPDEIKSPKLTADWENALLLIERGEASDKPFLSDISDFVIKLCREYSSKADRSAFTDGAERKIIGICPKCGKNVISYQKVFSCESGKNGCGFVIWKERLGKTISENDAREILENGKSALIKGFKSKAGNKFDAYLSLDGNKEVIFEFPPRKSKEGGE